MVLSQPDRHDLRYVSAHIRENSQGRGGGIFSISPSILEASLDAVVATRGQSPGSVDPARSTARNIMRHCIGVVGRLHPTGVLGSGVSGDAGSM